MSDTSFNLDLRDALDMAYQAVGCVETEEVGWGPDADRTMATLGAAYVATLARAETAEAERDRLLRSDRFLGEPTAHETLGEAQASWERHQQDMRQERRERFERRIQAALEQNPAALTYATPHGLAAYLADALTGTGEAHNE